MNDIHTSALETFDQRVLLTQIYDAYRTALLNVFFFEEKLRTSQNWNRAVEITIAVTATSSGGIPSLGLWQHQPFHSIWLAICAFAVTLTVVNPILQFGKQIEKYTKLYSGHQNIYLELGAMIQKIARTKKVIPQNEEKYVEMDKQMSELARLGTFSARQATVSRLQEKVNRQIPPDDLWMP